MVFVHGFGTDQTAWRDVARAFFKDYRVLLLDNAGAGRSAPEAFVQHRYLGLRAYADDLIAVCEAAGVRDAVLVGHSVGAMICLLAANAVPTLAAALVLVGASPRYLDEPGYHGGFSEADLQAIYSAVADRYGDWAEHYARAAMDPGQPELARQFAATLKQVPADHALTVLCSIFQSDLRAELAHVKQPTLIVQARDDVAVPRDVADYLHRNITGSTLRVIEAAGHLPHVSAPAIVLSAMTSFLADDKPR
jgi:sigma-B regulation protein RsbQ